MKSRLSRSILFILILSLALQTITLPALAQSEPNESQAEIENLVDLQEMERPAYPNYRESQLYTEYGFENLPPELAERYQRDSEYVERPEYTPPSPEIIAKTQAQVNAFDCSTVTDVVQIECEALVDFYSSTNGAGWKNNTNWLQTTTVSNWYGVYIWYASHPHVETIDLWSNNLVGTIPESIKNFTDLVDLLLGYNSLTGSISEVIINSENIGILSLHNNYFYGELPSDLTYNFQRLNLSSNNITGVIPTKWGNLEELYLSYNKLTGNIPVELASMDRLKNLGLGYNELSGTIPSELENLPNLRSLGLNNNLLSGNIPTNLPQLPSLRTLNLSNNQLSGDIPSTWDISNEMLYYVDLSYNSLTGVIPVELVSIPYLEYLYISGNQLTGSIPLELGNLTYLEGLDLSNNQLTGTIPPALGNLSFLKLLYLSGNQLTGSIPAALGNLSKLEALDLSQNQLTGSIPAELGSLSNLWILYLFNNQLTGSIPPSLGNLSGLWYLHIFNNRLTGNIPATLGNLSDLKGLGLNQNQLTESIPAALGNLSDLEELGLSQNQLTGSIPAELGQLTDLHYLRLNQNAFVGEIPNSFVNLVNLCEGIDEDNGCWFPESGLDLGYNRLNVPAQEPVASFLDIKDPDWYLTQAVEVTIPGESGGTVQSNDGLTEIEIPAGAYTGEMIFHFVPQPSPGHPFSGLMEANNNFELIASAKGIVVNDFNLPITITINYSNQQIGPVLEDSLKLYHWDGNQSTWTDAVSACSGGEYIRMPSENWLSLPLCELGEFALLGEAQNIYLPLVTR